jgi:CubicO group peptidase (beta-lactamase class C family)
VLPEAVTLDNWQDGPGNRWSFQHVPEVVQTVEISRGDGPVAELTEGTPLVVPDLDGFLTRTFTDSLLVLRGREIVLERYLNHMTPSTRHLLQSVSKSLCGALVGRLVDSGRVDVEAAVAAYLPELAGSGYADATVRQVLDMTSGVAYDETYDNPDSEVQRHERVGGWRTARPGDPEDTYAFLASLQPGGSHGGTFTYCSANTEVLAWVVERVTGRGFVDVLQRDLWGRIGAEHDACVTVDGRGFPMASGGICVTTRDLARFGRVLLDGGRGPGGAPVVPATWIADIRAGGDPAAAAESMGEAHPQGSYRSQFWVTGDAHGCFYGVGIYGQYLWLNPEADVVVVKLSSLPAADDTGHWLEHVRFFDALSSTGF